MIHQFHGSVIRILIIILIRDNMSGCLIKTIKLRIASPNNNSHVESHASIYKRVKEMKDKDTAINARKLARINYDQLRLANASILVCNRPA